MPPQPTHQQQKMEHMEQKMEHRCCFLPQSMELKKHNPTTMPSSPAKSPPLEGGVPEVPGEESVEDSVKTLHYYW